MPMLSSLRSWFGRAGAQPPRPAQPRTLLRLERLETREVPAALPTLRVGANVNTGHMNGSQSESIIAVDPRNPLRQFAAANDNAQATGLYGSFSTNGGATWTSRRVALGTDIPTGSTDPTVAWDTFGNLFFGYFDAAAATPTLVIALSTNGGQSFTALPTNLPIVDYPTITVGAGLVSASYVNGGVITVSTARVTGLGQVGAFTTQTVPGSTGGNFGDIAIGPNGQITVDYMIPTAGAGPTTIFANTDPDGAGPAGFGNAVTVTTSNVGGFAPIPAQPVRTIDSEPRLVYDRSNSAFRGRLYMIYTDRASLASSDTNVFMRISTNNGANWSGPIRLNDDNTSRSQFWQRIAIDQTTGNIGFTWYDCRLDAGQGGTFDRDGIPNTDAVIFVGMALPGGTTRVPNIRVAAGPSNANLAGNNSGNDYGDYIGVDFVRGAIYPCWVDNSVQLPGNTDRPNFDIATAKVTVIPPAPPVPRIFYPVRYVFDPATRLYRGNLTLSNVGTVSITGPAVLIFTALPRGVTLANATGTRNGFPTLTVPFGTLAPGQSLRVPIALRNPFNVPISTFFVGFGIIIVLPNS